MELSIHSWTLVLFVPSVSKMVLKQPFNYCKLFNVANQDSNWFHSSTCRLSLAVHISIFLVIHLGAKGMTSYLQLALIQCVDKIYNYMLPWHLNGIVIENRSFDKCLTRLRNAILGIRFRRNSSNSIKGQNEGKTYNLEAFTLGGEIQKSW